MRSCDPTAPTPTCPLREECDLLTATCLPRVGASCEGSDGCRPGEVCAGAQCVPDPKARRCQGKADCSLQEACRLVLSGDATPRIEALCGPALGPGEPGAPCEGSGECDSGICLRVGVCFRPCSPDTGICGELLCGKVWFSAGPGRYQAVSACLPKPAPCHRDSDCLERGGVCKIIVEPLDAVTLTTACGPASSPAAAGVSCTANSECSTGLCLSGACFTACRDDRDCRSGSLCRPRRYAVGPVQGEIDSCVKGP